jgi:hypothetical protein
MSTTKRRGPFRRVGRALTGPFRGVWRFGSWGRHPQEDTEAVYGANPNELSPEERALKAGIIAGGLGAGSSGAQAGF